MASKWEQWNVTASTNTAAPPNGAPENMAAAGLNDTMRLIMAAIKELGNEVRTGDKDADPEDNNIGLDDLGSMATQNKSSVDIVGGNIGGGVNIDASRLTSGTIPQARIPVVNDALRAVGVTQSGTVSANIQELYNMMWPVNSIMFRDSGASTIAPPPTVPTGITATWELVSTQRYIRIMSADGAPNRTGGTYAGVTEPGGVHNHGGLTGHPNVKDIAPPEITMPSSDVSTGRTHDHSIFNTGTSHTHGVDIRPEWIAFTAYRRTA